jgi:hypothetical protein
MSKFLTASAVSEFDAEVKHEYQGMATLRPTVTVRTNVTGESYRFARMGKGMANQKPTQADVTPMNISHARQIAYLYNWNAPEYTDIFDQAEVNFDEKQELAQTLAGAMGRREDQIILDTVAGADFAATNDLNPDTGLIVDADTADFSVSVVQRARQHFQELETTVETHFCVEAEALQVLLATNQLSSSDYNIVKALVEGDLKTKWMGFSWHVIGKRAEGGLDGVTGTMTAYAWAKNAVGFAIGIDMRTEVNYIPQKTSWLSNCLYKAGAVLREPQGIVKITYDET